MRRFFVRVISTLAITVVATRTGESPAPTLSLSANNEVTLNSYRGWPLLVRVEVMNESLLLNPASTNVQVIAAVSNSWANVVRISAPAGTRETWPLQLANAPSGALNLTSDSGGEAGWWMSPDATTHLASGAYTLQAILETTASPDGWQGTAKSQVITVNLQDESATLTPELAAEKLLRLADYAVWQNDLGRANDLIDQLLALQSTNVTALTRKADLLLFTHEETQALNFYQFAVQAYFLQRPGPDAEPPAALLKQRRALLAKVAFQPGDPQLSLKVWRGNDGRIHLDWASLAGQTYSVESTHDFKTWQTEAAGLQTDQVQQSWTTSATASPRFFRVVKYAH